MPLIIMCGLPCSGKTRRADEISRLLERECGDSAKVNIVCEDFSSQTRNDLYSSTKEEKIARGNLKSQVKPMYIFSIDYDMCLCNRLSVYCHVILT